MQARWGTHGDHPVIALAPSSVQETYDLTFEAFNLAEQYMVPVILLLDEIVGHMREGIEFRKPERIIDRKKPVQPPESYRPYETDDSLIPALAPFGQGYRYHVTGLIHDETGFPSNNPKIIEGLLKRINEKIDKHADEIIRYNSFDVDDADVILLAYGSPVRSAHQVQQKAREDGLKVGLVQLITVWPFPHKMLRSLYNQTKAKFIVPELSLGQLADELSKSVPLDKIIRVNRNDGSLITPAQLDTVVREAVR